MRQIILLILIIAAVHAYGDRPADESALQRACECLAKKDRAGCDAILNPLQKALEVRLAANAKDAEAHYLLGRICFIKQDDDDARKHYEDALAINDKDVDFHFHRGVMLAYGKDRPESIKSFQQATKLDPNHAEAFSWLGKLLDQEERNDEAKTAYQQAVKLNPANAVAWVNLGALWNDEQNIDEAVRCYEKAIEANPKLVSALANLGQVNQLRNKPQEALEWYLKVLEIKPDDWKVHAKLVQLYQRTGDAKSRDEHREWLAKQFKAGSVKDALFCREQFDVGKYRIFAYEYFELKGEMARRYSFQVVEEGKPDPSYRIVLESDEADTQMARELKEIGKDDRAWSIDSYFPNKHATYDLLRAEPSYEEVRAIVVEVVEGKRKEISSTTTSVPDAEKK